MYKKLSNLNVGDIFQIGRQDCHALTDNYRGKNIKQVA